MTRPREIPPAVTDRQIEASDPGHSVFVAANAGSGKTHVLAQRVIRLLLAGVDPARILCITFTKAAAANMANRVFDDLRQWTRLDDLSLDESMRKAGVRAPSPALRQRARRLFALALETPGGLKVQTIHAFCTQLLHLFPFEANVAARFEVLDEAAEAQLLEALSLDVMLEAAAQPDGPLGKALSVAVLAAADVTFRELVRETIRKRDRLVPWIDAAGGLPQAMLQLSEALGVGPDETAGEVEAALFDGSVIAASEWMAIAAAFAQSPSKSDQDQSARFASLGKLADVERLEAYLDVFCTSERDKTRARLATKAIQTDHPALCKRLEWERNRVWALVQRRRLIEVRDRSAALFTIAHAVIERFRAEKNRRGLLDYQDLIDKTLDLLNNVSAGWVHYKLDRGIHHVLIDEAQDTSPKQWDIVNALTGEFFTGSGAHERPRTIFAVGDEKQSIFSFQGAVPREFAERRRLFERLHLQAELEFVATRFNTSFRSGPNVLGAVDTVFSRVEAYTGLTDDPVGTVHESLPDAAPGLVEIWDLEKSDEVEAKEGWAAPLDLQTVTSGTVRLAQRIAGSVAAWRAQGFLAKDVLILVRRRGALFEAIIRALKNKRIPVAGADRLMLTEHIAVMDLMTLADALLLPQNDLALATVLKSPLFGLGDDELFKLAWDRKGSLVASLRTQRPDVAAELDRIAAAASEQTPFAFYAGLLGAGGRRKFFARLGHEAADALDEFLNLALDYERRETPSLQGFVAWLRNAQAEVKRDMELARDEVRVMTVHGAKGLEAPIVVLADTTTPAQGWHPPRLLPLTSEDAATSAIVWAKAKALDVGPMIAAREAVLTDIRNEYRRLLYVAMTRAIDRLVVCGIDPGRKLPEGCWYELARDALEAACVKEPADFGSAEVWRYRNTPDRAAGAAQGELDLIAAVTLPPWLTRHVGTAPERPATIKPSGFVDDPVAAEPVAHSQARERAIARGLAIHRLMQSLPDVPPERRADAAALFLAHQKKFDDAESRNIAQQVHAVLADPRFAALFGPGSRAEVSITGRLNGRPVAGQVDRLVVTADEVLIADYKSNRPPPTSLGEALESYGSYVKQLALYRDVLKRLYPGRAVRAALLWTETPELMEIPPRALEEALESAVTTA